MSNLKDIKFESKSNQNPPTDKKQVKKDRAVLIYDEQHKLLKAEAFRTEKEMREIASEAIDFYFKNKNL